MKDLWNDTLTNHYLGDPEVNNLDFLNLLGLTLGNQPILLKNLYLSYTRKEKSFTHKPMIGAVLSFEFDYVKRVVCVSRSEESTLLRFSQFQKYIGLIDLLFSEVCPIGTVVELDKTLLSQEIQEMYSQAEEGLLVTIHGRRIVTEKENEFIDYVASIWPFGIMDEVDPIYLNPIMIKRVVSMGMTNDTEKLFVIEVLRKQLLNKGVCSYLYNDPIIDLNREVTSN